MGGSRWAAVMVVFACGACRLGTAVEEEGEAKVMQLVITGKNVEVFSFKPEPSVKLSNVEAVRKLLDNMYKLMDTHKLSEVVEEHGPPVPEKQERERFLFTVRICIAEGLTPLESSPSSRLDTCVTLSDEGGNRLAKTRTIYETLTPRCAHHVLSPPFRGLY